jgi:cytochrome P450
MFHPYSTHCPADGVFRRRCCPSQRIDFEACPLRVGQGLIPADGEVWKTRRRAIVPSLHRKYIESMVNMFGDCVLHGASVTLDKAIDEVRCLCVLARL